MIRKSHRVAVPARKVTAFACAFASLALAFSAGAALAQYGGSGYETLRNPLIPGAAWVPPYTAPDPGQGPPVGNGMMPQPVTPGHLGPPPKPASHVDLPPLSPLDKDVVNALTAPYLEPPPSAPGPDPYPFNGPENGYIPPVAAVNINPEGGISGDAPLKRWGGQTTRDLGYPRTFGAQTTDFGQDIDEVASVGRSSSQDGPRPAQYPGQMSALTNRQGNLPGATATSDLHGNRIMFKGPYLRSRMTIAPY